MLASNSAIENVIGGPGNNFLKGNDLNNTLIGGQGMTSSWLGSATICS